MVADKEKPIWPGPSPVNLMLCSAIALSAAKVTSRLFLVALRLQSLSAGPAKVTVTVSSAAVSPSRFRV